MRIHITTTPNKELVTFNYQPKLVGTLHKWLGINDLHGNPALYSFSWLLNAKTNENGLNYPNGATMFISFYDDNYLKQVVKSIMNDTEMCYGMRVTDITIEDNLDLTNKTLFQCASPIFIRRFEGDNDIHYTFKDKDAGRFLEETLLHKMELAGLPKDESLKINFDTSAFNAKTKVIDYRGIKNRVNLCPVIIEGKPETKLFAWNVGLGNSTGIGFGAIY
ncbi:MAG: CRISPR-associated endoribonuclease Cas6 [Candidatus Symbiothrix sp.]|jgi:CRISPR-associated endoribonuclease Cas6|nr:CRISPR-associated endoribonuclease Cas6 [Candidatus Symbiothrix sp.]